MGNNQSNETERKKEREKEGITTSGRIYKIQGKFTTKRKSEILPESLKGKDFIYYLLEDVKEKSFQEINCANYAPFNTYQAGDYIRIKLIELENFVGKYNLDEIFSVYIFDDNNEIAKVEGAWKDSEGNIRDSGGSIITDTVKLIAGFGEAFEWRQKYGASIEQSRRAENYARTRQTSWDMPPGWK